jgi:hypothetical protein
VSEETPFMVVDGEPFTEEQVIEIVRLMVKRQFWSAEELLKEKGLTAIERVEHFEPVAMLPEGWRILAGHGYLTQHDYLTLAIPYERVMRISDEQEFRALLREKIQAFGDVIMDGWRAMQELRK